MAFVVKNTMDFRVLDLVCPHSCRGCGRLGGLLCGRCKKHIKKELSVVKKTDFEDLDMYLSPREGILFEMVKEYKYSSVRDMSGVLAGLLAEEVAGVLNRGGCGMWSGAEGATVSEATRGGDASGEEKGIYGAEGVVVVPLPTISRHIRERGFDHTWRLAKEVAKRLRWEEDGCFGGARDTLGRLSGRLGRNGGGLRHAQKELKAAQLLAREGSSVQVGKEAEEREKQAREAYKADLGAISRYVLGDFSRKKGSSGEFKGAKGDFGCEKSDFEDFEQPTVLLIDDVWTTGASMRAGVRALREAGVKKIVTAVICAGK